MYPAISAEGLYKTYRSRTALKGLNLTIAPGTIYGLIGPNGAGKTTTLAILAGLRRASSGSAKVLDIDVRPNHRALASRIGFSSPQYPLFDYLSGGEILMTCGLLHGLTAPRARERGRDLLELLDLAGAAGHFVHEYSQGMRQKLGLACAMIHAPGVLLLDEPFEGLDAVSVYRVLHVLRQISARGKTILLTSHDLARIGSICHRVGILHEGELKRETDLPGQQSDHGQGETGQAGSERPLEQLLWQVVGTPITKDLSWV